MKTGIIGGSGLYALDGLTGIREVSIETPFGPPSDALICAQMGDADVVFLARHGRGHTILPSEINHRANIYAMKSLGVEAIVSVSAVGSLKEEYAPGDIVLVDQFVDRTRNAAGTFFGDGIVAHISLSHPTCSHLADLVTVAAEGPIAATAGRLHRGGTYLNMAGPAFSTLAESMLYRQWGLDVIGMTNMPEARLCREAEICYQSVAMVTDYDCWHETEAAVSVEMIIATLHRNTRLACAILRNLIPLTNAASRADIGCQAVDALKYAIITHPDRIQELHRRRLAPIISRYFPLA